MTVVFGFLAELLEMNDLTLQSVVAILNINDIIVLFAYRLHTNLQKILFMFVKVSAKQC